MLLFVVVIPSVINKCIHARTCLPKTDKSIRATSSFLIRYSGVFFLLLLLRELVQGVDGGLLFVVVTAPNLICNGYQLVWVFTIANGENKSLFAMFINFILSICVIGLITRGIYTGCLIAPCTKRSEIFCRLTIEAVHVFKN